MIPLQFSTAFSKLKKNNVIIKFLSSSLLSLPVSIVISFITLRKIDPYYMGVWSAITIIESYATILRLGVVNGMNRELPYYIGMGRTKEAVSFAESTLGFSILNSVILLFAVPFFLLKFELNATYIVCIVVILFRTILTFYATYLTGTFRTTDHFNKLSNIQFTGLIIKLTLVPLIIYWGFTGYLIMESVLVTANTILLHYFRPLRIKPKLNFKVLAFLMKIGLPLFITSFLISFVDTIPRLFIVYYGDERMLGLYSPVIMIITAFSLLPSTIGSYYYPRFTYLYGKNKDPKEIWRKLLKVYSYSSLFIIMLIIGAFVLLDDLIRFFPKYKDSLPYMKLCLFVGPFVLSKLGNLINVVLKKVSFMGLHVFLYALFQISYLVIFKHFSGDILFCAVISQVLTSISLFVASLFLNLKVVNRASIVIKNN